MNLWLQYKQENLPHQSPPPYPLPTAPALFAALLLPLQDPAHPLLKHERQPTELSEDGTRPRIMSPANAEAQIARLAEELRAAKAGEAPAKATGASRPLLQLL